MTDFNSHAVSYINWLISILRNTDINSLKKIEEAFIDAYKKDKVIYIMWNWGSASTASHYSCDFSKWTACQWKRRFKFISLNDNISHFTAIANDISFDDIFSEQLKNVLTPDDLVVVLSASWNSKNIIKALEYAKSIWSKTIAMVWFKWGRAKEMADIYIHVDSMEYWPVEDVHMIFDHLLSSYFKTIIEQNEFKKDMMPVRLLDFIYKN